MAAAEQDLTDLEKLVEIQERANLTNNELAVALGIARSNITHYLSCDVRPGPETSGRIARLYDLVTTEGNAGELAGLDAPSLFKQVLIAGGIGYFLYRLLFKK